jgi:hypothetical protein
MKPKRRWLIIVSVAVLCCAGLSIVGRTMWLRKRALTHVLNVQWNPYNNPPDFVALYPYSQRGSRLTWYVFWNDPSVDELSSELLRVERDLKVGQNHERARRVAEELLREYHSIGAF